MIERKDIEKLAELSLLAVLDAELEKIRGEIAPILAYVSELQALAGEDEVPQAGALRNVMREDDESHEGGIYTQAILAELPQREGDYMKVKKIL